MKTKQKGKEFWISKITAYRNSGMSRKEFCSLEGISYWTFSDWLKKAEGKRTTLVKITREKNLTPPDICTHIDIHIGSTIVIRVENGFDRQLLRDIVCDLGNLS